jgi:hypothetical protein
VRVGPASAEVDSDITTVIANAGADIIILDIVIVLALRGTSFYRVEL